MEEQLQTLDQIKRTVIDLALHFGPKLLVAVAILVAGIFVGRWAGRVIGGALVRFELEPPVRDLLVRIVYVLVLAVFAILALQNLGVELLPLIAGLGVAGAGIALAMQGVLGNVAGGLTIIFTKPFVVGEYISIVGEEGEVERISLFSTVLGHTDRSKVIIPNRQIVGEILHNYGRIRQLSLTVGVAYDSDLATALETVREVLRDNPRALQDPAPVIGIATLADSSINIAVKPWANVPDYVDAGAEINQAIVEAFRAKRISIPFPQREVRMLSRTS